LKGCSPRNPHVSLRNRRGVLAAFGAGSLSVLLHGCGGAAADAAPNTPPRIFTLDPSDMLIARQRIAARDASLQPSYNALLASAGAALLRAPYSVTDKNLLPPSADKHDYLSLAPYWWPDPAKPNGLPYIQRDGEINPSSKDNDSDSMRMQSFCRDVGTLTTAYFLSGDGRYADRAALLLRTWFITPATRMNPNLNYGQGIPGKTSGRGIGIIDTRNFWQITDGIGLIAASGALSPAEQTALTQWFSDYLTWLLTSANGREEAAATNNHGSFYDAQVVNLALFTRNTALAKSTLGTAMSKRMPVQFDASGKEPMELSRTRPFHYSVFNLVAFMRLAHYGTTAGVDIWGASLSGSQPTLLASVAFLAPYVANPSRGPYEDLTGVEYNGDGNEFDGILPVLQQAALHYGATPALNAALGHVRAKLPAAMSWLHWPLRSSS
jgi:hypothetical protein